MIKEFFKKYYKTIVLVICCVSATYLFIYFDIFLRARSAYLEAEKYMDWYYHPHKKIEYLQKLAEKEKQKLEKLLAKKKISEQEYKIKLELIEFNKQRQIEESSLKYAYIWYKTVLDLFTPPQTKWAKLAKQKIDRVKQMWKTELEQKGYKIEDYMIE